MNRTRWLIGVGAVAVVAALGVRFVAAPALVRFPLGLDKTTHYSGQTTTFVGEATGAPLATPTVAPLTVDRRVHVVSGSFSQAVVEESIRVSFGGTTNVQTYRYVMDRKSMKLLNNSKSFAFGSGTNLMTPSNGYRLNFPIGSTATRSYLAYDPTTNTLGTLKATGPAQRDPVSGMKLLTFATTLNHPVASYYMPTLESMGMPTQLGPTAVSANLAAHGADVTQVIADIGTSLTPDEASALTAVLAKPVALNYSYFQQGTVQVDPKTGAVISGASDHEGISVTPDMSAADAVTPILAKYASFASVQSLMKAMTDMSGPQVVVDMTYHQTPASVRDVASTAKSQGRQIDLLERRVPAGLLVIGLALLVLGLAWRPRRFADVHEMPVSTPAQEQHRAAS